MATGQAWVLVADGGSAGVDAKVAVALGASCLPGPQPLKDTAISAISPAITHEAGTTKRNIRSTPPTSCRPAAGSEPPLRRAFPASGTPRLPRLRGRSAGDRRKARWAP